MKKVRVTNQRHEFTVKQFGIRIPGRIVPQEVKQKEVFWRMQEWMIV